MKKNTILLIYIMGIGLFCSEYNPFENPANVKMEIDLSIASIATNDSAYIFSSETLFVAGAVREEIDSFSISVNNNRFFSDTTIIAPIKIGNYAFPFSFVDTGLANITLITYRKNGDDVQEDLAVTVKNPLLQDTVIISEALIESLYTTAVSDTGIRYNWSLSPNREDIYTISQKSNTFSGNITLFDHNSSLGYLWVVDNFGNESPRSTFVYQFIDSVGPIITSDNDGYNPATNVIVSGDKTFILKVHCNDLSGISAALVSDSSFDSFEIKSNNERIYYKTFYSIDTITDSMAISVSASDNLNHVSSKTFYLKYDEAGPKEVFRLISPASQPYTTSSAIFNIQMQINNLFTSSMKVIANHIEGGIIDTLDTIAVSDTARIITFPVNLAAQDNIIIFTAVDTLGGIATDTIKINYNATSLDVNAPHISSIEVNGVEGDDHIVSTNYAILKLSAYDENLDSVIINGESKALGSNYIWLDTIVTTTEKTAFIIRLVDAFGNATDKKIWVQKNNIPIISEQPLWPKTLVVGTTWKDTLRLYDEDGDSLKLTHLIRTLDNQNSATESYQQILQNSVMFKKLSRFRWEVSWSGLNITDSLKGRTIPTAIVIYDFKQDSTYNWDFSIVDSADAKAYDFTVTLPKFIDTTKNGAVDLSQIMDTIVLSAIIENNSQTLSEYDTITLTFNEQIIKYNSTNGNFDIVIDVGSKEIDSESIVISVTDTLGYVTIVDTLDLIYYKGISLILENLIAYDLTSDNSESLETEEVDTGIIVTSWQDEAFTFIQNSNVGSYPYHTTLIDDSFLNTEVIHFNRSAKNSLYSTSDDIVASDFTMFIVAKLDETASADSSYCLFSASEIYRYVGFGIVNGVPGMIGDSTVEITKMSELRGGPNAMDNGWHIYTISSNSGIKSKNDTSNVNILPANIWIDGYRVSCDTCVAVGTAGVGSYPYLVIGGGGKHYAENGWQGDIFEVMKFNRALSASEIEEVNDFIASELKIDINKFGNKSIQIKRY